jgi:hypothetical protein
MIKRIIAISLLAGLAPAEAAKTERELTAHKNITGVYRVYGGSLGDSIAPSAKDAKIMMSVEGTMAKEMFDAIGPDVRDVCTEGSGTRVRQKANQNVHCIRSSSGEYSCNFGFDLRNGKSIPGIVC